MPDIQEPRLDAVPTKKHKPKHKKKPKNRARVSKKLIGIFAAVAIVILSAILIFTHTICLNHAYSEANVLEPQTCYHCGKTKGEPKPLMEIEFPTKGIGSLLPLPESNMGEILWADSNSFNAYIGNTTQVDFNEYVKKCSDVGFDIDYQKGNNFYYSEDSYGNNLDIWYYENDIMQIQIYSEDAFDDAPTQNQGNSKEIRLSNCEENGHQADDWQIIKEATYSEHGEKIRLCTECNEIIESQSFELTSCIDNNRFVFTPVEFTSKLNEELEEIEGNYGTFIGVRDEDNVLASCIFRNTESSGVCHIIYMDGDETFTGDSAKTYTGADCVGIIFDGSCDAQELSRVLPAILCSLNPSYSFENAVGLSNSIIEKSEESAVIEDGIVYRLVDVSGIMDSNWWLYIMIEE